MPPPAPELPAQALPARRLRLRIVLLAVIPLLLALGIIAAAVTLQARELAARERVVVETATLAAKRAALREQADMALGALAPLYTSGRDDEATRRAAIRLLASLDFGSDGYFFLYDFDGRNLMHPRQPELVGRNLWDMRDVNGVAVIQELIAGARAGGGFVHYTWNKPSAGQQAPKLGYAVSMPRWGWVLGTGIYLDDVQATLAQIDRQVEANVTATMWWIAGIALASVGLIAACGLALNVSESRLADAKLRLLARQLVQSQEAERAHLSRELHDSVSQTLVSTKLLVESAIAQLGAAAPAGLARAAERLTGALGEVRGLSHRLRPAELDVLGLPAALAHLGREFADTSGRAISVRVRGDAPHTLGDEIKTVLFRVTQEALTNIQKHAGAERVALRLACGAGGLRLRVVDDGAGFDVDAVRLDPRRGIGLRNMRERLASVGGTLGVRSRAGCTQVVAHVPAAALRRFAQETAG